jgi:hypothetical protein
LEIHDAKWLVLRAGKSNFRGHDFPVEAVFAFLALAAIAKFSSDGEILLANSTFGCDVFANTFDERFNCHDSKVLVTPGPDSRRASSLLLVTQDKYERYLLQRMLADFIRNFFVPKV